MSLLGGSRRGRPPGSSSRAAIDVKSIIAVLFLIVLVVGAMTYFGSAIGSKTVDFIDLEVRVGSISLPLETYGGIIGHDIIGVKGFNGFVVRGTVRANKDIDYSGLWVGVRVVIAGYSKYDPSGCGRTFYPGPSFTIPDSGSYFGVLNLAGMKAGETRSFEFIMTAQDVLKWTYYQKFAYESSPPQGVEGWGGRVDVVILDTGGNEPRRTTVGYEVLQPIAVLVKREEALRWEFQYLYGTQCVFRCIGFGADGIEVQKQSIELYPSSVEVKLKLSATFALLSAIVIITSTMLVILRIKER